MAEARGAAGTGDEIAARGFALQTPVKQGNPMKIAGSAAVADGMQQHNGNATTKEEHHHPPSNPVTRGWASGFSRWAKNEIVDRLLSSRLASKKKQSSATKVQLQWKETREMNNLHLCQRLGSKYHRGNPIRALEFHPSGIFLATAGGHTVVVWLVLPSHELAEERQHPAGSDKTNQEHLPLSDSSEDAEASAAHSRKQRNHDTEAVSSDDGEVASAQVPNLREGDDDLDIDEAENAEEVATSPGLFRRTPYRIYTGHIAEVVCLTWSKSQFLISGSIDRTARLWHVSREDCLCVFQHSDFVTSVAYHPTRDGYFVTGSFDQKIRLWNIPDGRVVQWERTPSLVTACSFNLDGSMIVAGLLTGQCFFYRTEGLKYHTQIECAKKESQQSLGKVSGLQFVMLGGTKAKSRGSADLSPNNKLHRAELDHYLSQNAAAQSAATASSLMASANPAYAAALSQTAEGARVRAGSEQAKVKEKKPGTAQEAGLEHLLVTTSDSRVRLYSIDGFFQVCKYKGHVNANFMMRASCSDDGRHVVCGSEDKNVYIWRLRNDLVKKMFGQSGMKNSNSTTEYFRASPSAAVTLAQFVPQLTLQRARKNNRTRTTNPVPENIAKSDSSAQGMGIGRLMQQKEPEEPVGLPGAIIVTAGIDGNVRVWENRET